MCRIHIFRQMAGIDAYCSRELATGPNRPFQCSFQMEAPLFELLHEMVNPLHLGRNIDALRAVVHALVAAYAMVCLTKTRHTAVIPHEKRTAGLPVVLILLRCRHIAPIDALVAVGKYSRDVQAVWTWRNNRKFLQDERICTLYF